MKCPSCSNDIFDFLQNPQVNRELMGMIESLQQQINETEAKSSSVEVDAADEKSDLVSGENDDREGNQDGDPEDGEDGNKEGNQNSPSKIISVLTRKRKKAAADNLKKANLEDEDGKEGNEDFPTNKIIAGVVTNKRKRATKAVEKTNTVINDVKKRTVAKRKTSAAVEVEPKVAPTDGEGKRRSKRLKAKA